MTDKLTGQQRRAALTLRSERPMCFPGSDRIIRESEAQDWHNKIVAAIHTERVPTLLVPDFCDVAGVHKADVEQTRRGLIRALGDLRRSQRSKPPEE